MRKATFSCRTNRPKQPAANPFLPGDDEFALFAPHEDPLGDFGLDDDEAQPELGDFWIEFEPGED